MADINQDSTYARSMDINFTPTASPIAAQREEFSKYNTDYTNFLAGQETVPQLQDRYSNRYNIPFLQQTNQQQLENMDFLGNAIKAAPASVNSASQNSLLTSGQKDRLVQARTAPLVENYGKIATSQAATGSQLATAESNLNKAISAEQAQQMKMTQPWLQKYDEMNIIQAAERTQWTQTNQWELNRLLSNQSTGVTLSEGQQNRLNQLAMQENAFQNELALLEKQNEYAVDMWDMYAG